MKPDRLLHAALIACVLLAVVAMYGNAQMADERARLEMRR